MMGRAIDERQPYPKYRWLVMATLCIAGITGIFPNAGYGPILGEVAKSLKVDLGAATQLLTVSVFVTSAVAIFAGMFCDKFGPAFTMALGILFSSIPSALLPWLGTTYGEVFVLRLIMGVSMGLSGVVIAPCLAMWFPLRERGLAGAIMGGSMIIGGAAGVIIAPALLQTVGTWQKTMALMSIPMWASLVMVLVVLRKPPPSQTQGAFPMGGMGMPGEHIGFKAVLSYPVTWVGSLLAVVNAWAMMGLNGLVPPLIAVDAPAGLGYGPMMSGKLSSIIAISGGIAPFLGGLFVDRVTRGEARPAVFLGFLITGLGGLFLLQPHFQASIPLLAVCLVFAGFGIAFSGPSMMVFVSRNFPLHTIARVSGLWGTIGGFGGAFGMLAAGLMVSKMGSYFIAVGMVPVACAIGCVGALFLKSVKTPESETVFALGEVEWAENSKGMVEKLLASAPGPMRGVMEKGLSDWIGSKGVSVMTEALVVEHLNETVPKEFLPMVLAQIEGLKSK
jgi:MFS family permease